MRSFLYGALGFILAMVVAIIFYSQYSDYRARAETESMLKLIAPTTDKILDRARKSGSLTSTHGAGRDIDPPHISTANVEIRDDGVIIMRGKKYDQLIVLIPSFGGYHYEWRCIGGPKNDVPEDCGQ